MKFTRKIRQRGCLVIPKEIRDKMGIKDDDIFDIYFDNDSIVIKKHNQIDPYDLAEKIVDYLKSMGFEGISGFGYVVG